MITGTDFGADSFNIRAHLPVMQVWSSGWPRTVDMQIWHMALVSAVLFLVLGAGSRSVGGASLMNNR